MSQRTRSKTTPALILIGVLMIVAGVIMNEVRSADPEPDLFGDSGQNDPDLAPEDVDEDRRLIQLQAVWGVRFELFEPADLDIVIVVRYDGNEYGSEIGTFEGSMWQAHFAASPGDDIVYEVSGLSGYLQAHILQDGAMVDWAHRNDNRKLQLAWTVT